MTEESPCPTPSPSTGLSREDALRAVYAHRRNPLRSLGLGDLADLLIAWAAGEVSEGFMVDITGMDRFALRGLYQGAIDRAGKLSESWRTSEDAPIADALALLGGTGSEPASSSDSTGN